MRRSRWLAFGALVAAAVISRSPVGAIMPNPQCVKDARAEMRQCKATCQDDFVAAKDLCRNVDHACADACRAGREVCVAGPLGALAACKDSCNATRDSAVSSCRQQFGQNGQTPDPAQLDQCIDAAQTAAFQCRDTCRENLDRGALKLCRQIFRACIHVCLPPPTPVP